MRILMITTNDGSIFYSTEWSYALVDSVELRADEAFGGVRTMELISPEAAIVGREIHEMFSPTDTGR